MPINLPKSPLWGLMLLLAACSQSNPDPVHIERDSIPEQWAEIAPMHAKVDSMFAPDIAQLLPPLDSVEQVLGRAFAGDSEVRLYGVANPYHQPIITSGDTIYIGLNHYLGPDYQGYIGRFPSYIRQLKSIERMPVDVVMARIAEQNPSEYPPHPNLLNHLLYQGALYLAVNQALGGEVPLSTLLGLSPEDMQWVQEHEADIWQNMVNQDMVFSTNSPLIRALVSPTPASPMLGDEAPGMAALYCGYRIAEAYCKKAGLTPVQMLANKDYNKNETLSISKYAPKR